MQAPELTRAELVRKDYHWAASFFEDRFSKYLALKEDGGPLAATYDHARHVFGNKFPAQTAEEVSGATYDDQTKRSMLPGRMPFVVCWYKPALKGRAADAGFVVERDAKGEAKRECRALYALWYEAFRGDALLRKVVQRAHVTSTEQGDADALGNPLIDETGRNVLHVFRANIEVRF